MKEKYNTKYGFTLLIIGVVLYLVHNHIGSVGAQDFISGFLLGVSIVSMVAGIFYIAMGLPKKK